MGIAGEHAWAEMALADAREALQALSRDPATVARIAAVSRALADVARAGNKILICGNGGSSADAMHFAEELTGRFRADRPPIAAIACTDPGHITCTANDYGYDEVFARWVRALGRPGDALIVLSTSGNSRNIIRAVEEASKLNLTTIALLGKGGGALRARCAHEWIIPGAFADRIQEIHMLLLHILIEGIERTLWPDR